MKKIGLILMLIIATACYHSEEPDSDVLLKIGDPMPWFEVTTLDGEIVTPATLAGRETVIVFFNTSCEDCRRELPEIQHRADAEPDVKYICIAREEEAATILPYWQQHTLTLPVAPQSDRRIYNLFALSGIPRQFRFSPAGHLISDPLKETPKP